ncbi:MAG: TonB-dependent receptor [Xanthomonadales bacterium]|nr:TonB-dependent receptor [Xanthomonadales bacterium]
MKHLIAAFVVLTSSTLISAGAHGDTIEETIVTAEKLSRTTFETGSSAAVLVREDIEISPDQDLSEVFAGIPNIAINPTNNDMVVRGIPRSGFGGGIGTVVYFMDGGPYLAFPRYTSVPTWDLQQIEVLRGAQSTAPIATVAGVVSLVPSAPTDQYEGQAALSYAPAGNQRAMGVAWGGPVDDFLAFRLAAHEKSGDGYISNVATGEDGWNSQDRRMFRLGVSFKPEKLEHTKFRVMAQWIDEKIDGTPWINRVPLADSYDPFDRQTEKHLPITTDNELGLLVVNIDTEINQRWQWDTTLTYHTVSSAYLDALNPLAVDPSMSQTTSLAEFDIASLETRAIFESEPWGFVAAVYLADLDFEGYNDFSFNIPFGSLGTAQATRRLVNNNVQNRLSALLLGTRQIGQRWSADLGVRVQWADPETDGMSTFLRTGSTGDPSSDAVIDQILAASAPPTAEKKSSRYTEWLPVFSISYAVRDWLVVGGKIEGGMRWGGQLTNPGQQRVVDYGPERATTFELFWRQNTGRFTLDANLFHTGFRDQQVYACFSSTSFDCHLANAQKSKSQGLEATASWILDEAWSLRAGLGINDTEFTEFSVGDVNWTGNEMPAPDRSFFAGLRYQQRTGMFADLEVLYESDAFATAANDPLILRDDRLLVDARAGWRSMNWEASIFARNLFNEEYFDRVSYALPGGILQQAFPGDPRVVGVEFRTNW